MPQTAGADTMDFGACSAQAFEPGSFNYTDTSCGTATGASARNAVCNLDLGWTNRFAITWDDFDDGKGIGIANYDLSSDCSGAGTVGTFKFFQKENSETSTGWAYTERSWDWSSLANYNNLGNVKVIFDTNFYSTDWDESGLNAQLDAFIIPLDKTSGGLRYVAMPDRATYYTGSQCETGVWGPINNDFGTGTVACGRADGVSLRFEGWLNVTSAGNHTLRVGGDDGVRLTVDGTWCAGDYSNHGYTTYTCTRNLSVGYHDIMLEYYEDGSGARVTLEWCGPSTTACSTYSVIPAASLYYSEWYKLKGPENGTTDDAYYYGGTPPNSGHIRISDPSNTGNNPNVTDNDITITKVYPCNKGGNCSPVLLSDFFKTYGTTSKQYKLRFWVSVKNPSSAGNANWLVVAVDDARIDYYTDSTAPTITDNQTGDDTVRTSNNGTYNVDFADTGNSQLSYFQTKVYTHAGQTGTLIQDWTTVASDINSNSYTADWALTSSTWTAMQEGMNYVSVKVCDGSANCTTLTDAFYVNKESQNLKFIVKLTNFSVSGGCGDFLSSSDPYYLLRVRDHPYTTEWRGMYSNCDGNGCPNNSACYALNNNNPNFNMTHTFSVINKKRHKFLVLYYDNDDTGDAIDFSRMYNGCSASNDDYIGYILQGDASGLSGSAGPTSSAVSAHTNPPAAWGGTASDTCSDGATGTWQVWYEDPSAPPVPFTPSVADANSPVSSTGWDNDTTITSQWTETDDYQSGTKDYNVIIEESTTGAFGGEQTTVVNTTVTDSDPCTATNNAKTSTYTGTEGRYYRTKISARNGGCDSAAGAIDITNQATSAFSSYSSAVRIDVTAPSVTFSGPSAASWQKADFAINISDSDAISGLSSCEYMVESYSGGSWTTTKSWTARTCNNSSSATITVGSAADCRNEGTGDNGNGACRVTVRATDVATNVTTLSARQFKIDWTSPVTPSMSSPAASSWQKADFAINVSDSDATSGLASCEYMVESNNGAWVTTKNWTSRTCNSSTSATITVLVTTGDCRDQGTDKCRVTLRSTDNAGNVSSTAQRLFSIDWTVPATPSFSAPAASSWQKADFAINVSDSDATSGLASCEYMVESNNGAWVTTKNWTSRTCNSSTSATITVLVTTGDCRDQGTDKCRVTLRSTDNAGNVSSTAQRLFSVDWTAPSFTLTGWDTCSTTQYTDTESYSDTTPCFSYAATDTLSGLPASPYTYVWGTDCSAAPATSTSASTYNPAAIASVDKYCFRVKAADTAGNETSVSTFTYLYNTVTPSWRYPDVGSQVGPFYGGGTIRTYGSEQRFYTASNGGVLYALNAADGTEKWECELDLSPDNPGITNCGASDYGPVVAAPFVFSGKIYIATYYGYVLRFADNGANWTLEASRDLGACSIQSATIAISLSGATKLLVGCAADFYALNDDATFSNWSSWTINPRVLTGSVTRSIPAFVNLAGGTDPWIYVATQNGTLTDGSYGRVYKIDVDNGAISTTFDDSSDFTGYLILRNYFGNAKQYLFVGGVKNPEAGSKFYALDTTAMPSTCGVGCITFNDAGAANGFEGGAAVSSGGSVIYAGNNNGKLYRLNFNGTTFTTPYSFSASSAIKYGVTFRQASGKLYFGTDAGMFFIVTDNGASFTENTRYHTGASVSATPAVNSTAGKVVVPSTIGRIFSFGL